ncbi:MAG: ATP-dependent Clp protease ATP-binding subunit ClpC, partial [Mycobacteriales bacterium]
KILFGDIRPGQIIIVDTDGAAENPTFTFRGEPKPTVELDSPLITGTSGLRAIQEP